MIKLALVGGGGFAKEVHEIALLRGYDVVGYFAEESSSFDLAYLGPPEAIPGSRAHFDGVTLAFGAVDRGSLRRRQLFAKWLAQSAPIAPAIISPHAIVGRGATVAEGAFVGHNVVLGPGCHIGSFALLNTGVLIGHDTDIGFGTIMAPHAFVGGAAKVGEGVLVGPGAHILQGLRLGSEVVVGIGAVVFRHLSDGATAWPSRMHVSERKHSHEIP